MIHVQLASEPPIIEEKKLIWNDPTVLVKDSVPLCVLMWNSLEDSKTPRYIK